MARIDVGEAVEGPRGGRIRCVRGPIRAIRSRVENRRSTCAPTAPDLVDLFCRREHWLEAGSGPEAGESLVIAR
jgi:hypothetical protein